MTYVYDATANKPQLGLTLAWIRLDFIENKMRNKENKTFLSHYPGAFEQLVCPSRGAFASLFSKNPNSRWSAPPGGGGGGHRWNWLMHNSYIGKRLSEKLQKLQNRAAKIIPLSNYETRSGDLLDDLGWERLDHRRARQLAILMSKIVNNNFPIISERDFHQRIRCPLL